MASRDAISCLRSLIELILYQVACILIVAFVVLGRDSETRNTVTEKPRPYKFGYKALSKHGDQWRAEVSDGKGKVIGSYGFSDEQGFRREVKYVADEKGFRVKVNTNEPGMKYRYNPANVILQTESTKNPASPKDLGAKVNTNEPGKKYRYNSANGMLLPQTSNHPAPPKIFRVRINANESGTRYQYNPVRVILQNQNILTPAHPKQDPQLLPMKESEIVDFYTVYAFSANSPQLLVRSEGTVQSPWFPIEVVPVG